MLRRTFEKRLRGNRAIGYARGEEPLGYAAEVGNEIMVEYDETCFGRSMLGGLHVRATNAIGRAPSGA
jgi:hypothetical protein